MLLAVALLAILGLIVVYSRRDGALGHHDRQGATASQPGKEEILGWRRLPGDSPERIELRLRAYRAVLSFGPIPAAPVEPFAPPLRRANLEFDSAPARDALLAYLREAVGAPVASDTRDAALRSVPLVVVNHHDTGGAVGLAIAPAGAATVQRLAMFLSREGHVTLTDTGRDAVLALEQAALGRGPEDGVSPPVFESPRYLGRRWRFLRAGNHLAWLGDEAVVCDDAGATTLWTWNGSDAPRRVHTFTHQVQAATSAPGAKPLLVASGPDVRSTSLWLLNGGGEPTLVLPDAFLFRSAAWSANARYVAIGGAGLGAVIVDLEEARVRARLREAGDVVGWRGDELIVTRPPHDERVAWNPTTMALRPFETIAVRSPLGDIELMLDDDDPTRLVVLRESRRTAYSPDDPVARESAARIAGNLEFQLRQPATNVVRYVGPKHLVLSDAPPRLLDLESMSIVASLSPAADPSRIVGASPRATRVALERSDGAIGLAAASQSLASPQLGR